VVGDRAALAVHVVEDRPDDVEAEVRFGPPLPRYIRTVSPTLARSAFSFVSAFHRAVEDHVVRRLRDRLGEIEGLVALLAVAPAV
jgi:hypothetical protein